MSTGRQTNRNNLNPASPVIAPKSIETCGVGRFRGCQRSFATAFPSARRIRAATAPAALGRTITSNNVAAAHVWQTLCGSIPGNTTIVSLRSVAWTGYTWPSVEWSSNDGVKGVRWHHHLQPYEGQHAAEGAKVC